QPPDAFGTECEEQQAQSEEDPAHRVLSPPAFVEEGVPAPHDSASQLDGDVGRDRLRIRFVGVGVGLTSGDHGASETGVDPAKQAAVDELLPHWLRVVVAEQSVGYLVTHDGDETFWRGPFGGCDVVRAVSGDEESRDLRLEWCGKNAEWSSARFREVVQEVLKVTTGGQDLLGRP